MQNIKNKLDSFNNSIKSLLKSYQAKSNFFDNEFAKLKNDIKEKDEIINQLEAKLDLIIKDRDQLKTRNSKLIEENNQINDEINFLEENLKKLQKWKKNILETIGDENYNVNLNDFDIHILNNDTKYKNFDKCNLNNQHFENNKNLEQKVNIDDNKVINHEIFFNKNYESDENNIYKKFYSEDKQENSFDEKIEKENIKSYDNLKDTFEMKKYKIDQSPTKYHIDNDDKAKSKRFNLNNSKNKFYLKKKINNISDKDSNSEFYQNDSKKYYKLIIT